MGGDDKTSGQVKEENLVFQSCNGYTCVRTATEKRSKKLWCEKQIRLWRSAEKVKKGHNLFKKKLSDLFYSLLL